MGQLAITIQEISYKAFDFKDIFVEPVLNSPNSNILTWAVLLTAFATVIVASIIRS